MNIIEPLIPMGWTYLRHGTNLSKWNLDTLQDGFVIGEINGKKTYMDLSCVVREDAIRDAERGYDTASNYGGEGGIEIRVLVYIDSSVPKYPECEYVKEAVSKEALDKLTEGYCWNRMSRNYQRHPIVPSGEKMEFLSVSYENEITRNNDQALFWYVPEFLLELYKKNCLNQSLDTGKEKI